MLSPAVDSPPGATDAKSPGSSRGKAWWLRRGRSDSHLAWMFVAPCLFVLIAMTIAAGIYVVYVSFYRIGSFGTPNQFVGWQNFTQAFTTYNFLPDISRTIGYVVVSVLIELVLGILLGLALSRPARGNRIAAAFFIIPFASTPAVSSLVFKALLDPNYGWVDYYLRDLGLAHPIQWLSGGPTAWVSLIGLDIWEWTPFVALIVLAGLQSLQTDVLEAARVDGASAWKRFRYITLPMLTPFLAIAGVLRVIQAFKTFDVFLVLTNGGPGTSTETVNLTIYRLVMQDFSIGSGAAIAVMLLVILLLLTPLLLKSIGRYAEHERGVA